MRRRARRSETVALLGALLLGCSASENVFLESPDALADGWVVALHRTNGSIEVNTRLDWSAALEIEATDLSAIELLAYSSFDLPLGTLPSASASGMTPRALPGADAVFRAEFEEGATTGLNEVSAPSAELDAYRYGVASSCAEASMKVQVTAIPGGNSSASWLGDGSALFSGGPIHMRVTRDSVTAFPRCDVANDYVSTRPRPDGSFVVVTSGPTTTATLRFDVANSRCEVLSVEQAPAERRLILDENLSGDPSAPIYALTSTGGIHRRQEDGTWVPEYVPPVRPEGPLANRLVLLQIAPGVLAGTYDVPSFFLWSREQGLRTIPLPEPPPVIEEPWVESMTFVPGYGLVVATGWGPIYRVDPEAPDFDELIHDFRALVTKLVPFRGGFIAFVKEGPAVQFHRDEICLPGITVSAGSMLSVVHSDDALVGFFREEPQRNVRWLSFE